MSNERSPSTATDEVKLLRCPFCNEDDFDDIGLKQHLLRGWCPAFEKVETT